MFHIPKNFSSHLSNFLSYEDGVKAMEEMNQILRATRIGRKKFNLLLILCTAFSFLSVPINIAPIMGGEIIKGMGFSVGAFMGLMFVPYVVYTTLFMYTKIARKNKLLDFIRNWNENRNDGVFLSLGAGSGTVRSLSIGCENSRIYEYFYIATMATWDPKRLMVCGFLHVFVNYQKRAEWCQGNGMPFVPPIPPHQQSIAQQIAPQTSKGPQGFQPAAGYTLVPQNQMPPPAFQVPAGYVLVPENQSMPPPLWDCLTVRHKQMSQGRNFNSSEAKSKGAREEWDI